jgi:hypothetical protein
MKGITTARENDTEDLNEEQMCLDLVRGDLRCLVHDDETF